MRTFNSIKAASTATGISKGIFMRAKEHPDSPKGLLGFHESGRIYFTAELGEWIIAHKEELKNATPGTLEYWQVERIKNKTLMLEKKLADRQSKVVNREDAIAGMERIAAAFKALVNGRFRTQIIEGLKLNPDGIVALDAALGDICGLWDTQLAAFKK